MNPFIWLILITVLLTSKVLPRPFRDNIFQIVISEHTLPQWGYHWIVVTAFTLKIVSLVSGFAQSKCHFTKSKEGNQFLYFLSEFRWHKNKIHVS